MCFLIYVYGKLLRISIEKMKFKVCVWLVIYSILSVRISVLSDCETGRRDETSELVLCGINVNSNF